MERSTERRPAPDETLSLSCSGDKIKKNKGTVQRCVFVLIAASSFYLVYFIYFNVYSLLLLAEYSRTNVTAFDFVLNIDEIIEVFRPLMI